MAGTDDVTGREYMELFSAGPPVMFRFAEVVVLRLPLEKMVIAAAVLSVMSEMLAVLAETRMMPFASRIIQVPAKIAIRRYTTVVIRIDKKVPLGIDFEASWDEKKNTNCSLKIFLKKHGLDRTF